MKKLITMFVLTIMVVTSIMPVTAFAATEPAKTIDQRIVDIKETYGITVVTDPISTAADKKLMEQMFTNLETALSYMGSQFTKKTASAFENSSYPDWQPDGFVIAMGAYANEPRLSSPANMNSNGKLVILACGENSAPPVKTILHEFGHAMHYATSNGKTAGETARGNFAGQAYTGKYESTATEGFITGGARKSWMEDYAETFAYMVMKNDQNKLTSGTTVYNKGKTVYDDLVTFVGTGSRTTQRVAANLGVEIKTDK